VPAIRANDRCRSALDTRVERSERPLSELDRSLDQKITDVGNGSEFEVQSAPHCRHSDACLRPIPAGEVGAEIPNHRTFRMARIVAPPRLAERALCEIQPPGFLDCAPPFTWLGAAALSSARSS